MPEEKGTGKHPHKSTEEPFPHHEGQQSGAGAGKARAKTGSAKKTTPSEQSELKEREYRDEQGNIHHHTKKKEEQIEEGKEE